MLTRGPRSARDQGICPGRAHNPALSIVDQAALTEARREHDLHGGDQAGPAVGDHQQGRAETSLQHPAQEPRPRVGGLGGPRFQAQEVRLPGHVDAPRHQHRLGLRPGVHPEVRAVDEQVLELDLREVPGIEGVELVLDGLADPGDRGARHRRLRSQGLGQSGLHVADRKPPDEPGDHERLQGVGLGDPGAEQAGGEGHVRPAELGTLQGDWPGGRLHGDGGEAVAGAGPGRLGQSAALVAVASEELGDLGLERRLQQQPGSEAGHLLQGLAEGSLRGEQVVDVGADALGG